MGLLLIILGIILGLLFSWLLGLILIVIGVVLLLAGGAGVGGYRYY
jgi:hypothetical protein